MPIVTTSHGGAVATLGHTLIDLFVYVHLLLVVLVFNLFTFDLI
jgi:hypothetical protein